MTNIPSRPVPPGTRLSVVEVFGICQRFIYPPCRKPSSTIELRDRIDTDLGYTGDSTSLLALKTNQAFHLNALEGFTSLDLGILGTVQDQVLAICEKLNRTGRLAITGDGRQSVGGNGAAERCGLQVDASGLRVARSGGGGKPALQSR